MRIVLDTNILVRAAADESGLAGKLLQLIAPGPHVLVISQHILGEVSRVLAYSRLQTRWRLTPERIGEFAARVATLAEIVPPAPAPRGVVLADPDDDAIIHTALSGRADVLRTRDAHLRHPSVVQFCARHSIQVMDDIELYRTLQP
jgi:putative PIN family toxin of toxin-antitoxin system